MLGAVLREVGKWRSRQVKVEETIGGEERCGGGVGHGFVGRRPTTLQYGLDDLRRKRPWRPSRRSVRASSVRASLDSP